MTTIEEILNKTGKLFNYYDIISEVIAISDENILLRLINYHDRLPLIENCEGPHSLCPEDMMRSVAAQSLIEKTGIKYKNEIQDAFERYPAYNQWLHSIIEASYERN